MSENGGYTATHRNPHWNLTLNPITTKWGQWSSWSAVVPATVRHVRCLNPHCWLNTTLSSVNPFFLLMKTTFLSWWNPHLSDDIPTCFSIKSPFCGWSPSVCPAAPHVTKNPNGPAAPAIQVSSELGAQVHNGHTTRGPCYLEPWRRWSAASREH